MNKSRICKLVGVVILIWCSIDISVKETNENYNNVQLYAGINSKAIEQGAKVVKGGWKWLKGLVGCKEVKEIHSIPKILPKPLIPVNVLEKAFVEIKGQDEVMVKVEEYLSHTKPGENGVKVINCVKTDANNVRMMINEAGKNKPVADLTIKLGSKAINIAEYDIAAIQEHSYKDLSGVEYIEFIIPKRAQYILNGRYPERVYECMVFNIPKDINGNWERFKEYLMAFLNDLVNRPSQLWDEYWFRRGLADRNIDVRDVKEIERYMFANIINSYKENEAIQPILEEIA